MLIDFGLCAEIEVFPATPRSQNAKHTNIPLTVEHAHYTAYPTVEVVDVANRARQTQHIPHTHHSQNHGITHAQAFDSRLLTSAIVHLMKGDVPALIEDGMMLRMMLQTYTLTQTLAPITSMNTHTPLTYTHTAPGRTICLRIN